MEEKVDHVKEYAKECSLEANPATCICLQRTIKCTREQKKLKGKVLPDRSKHNTN